MLPTTILACKLIAFSQAVGSWTDQPVYVNPCFVTSVTSTGPNTSLISSQGKEPTQVKGPAVEVAEKINRSLPASP